MTPLLSAVLLAGGRIVEVLLGAVIGGWLVSKANRKTNVALARDISHNQAEVDERLEGIRSQLQLQTQNSTFYARRQHTVYAKLFRLFNMADGALCGRSTGYRRVHDIDNMDRAQLAELADAYELAPTIREKVLRVWDGGAPTSARDELKAALKRVEESEGLAALSKAKNYAIVNALYLSPAIETEVWELVQSLTSYSAEISIPDATRYKQRADLVLQVGTRLARLREAMRNELRG